MNKTAFYAARLATVRPTALEAWQAAGLGDEAARAWAQVSESAPDEAFGLGATGCAAEAIERFFWTIDDHGLAYVAVGRMFDATWGLWWGSEGERYDDEASAEAAAWAGVDRSGGRFPWCVLRRSLPSVQ